MMAVSLRVFFATFPELIQLNQGVSRQGAKPQSVAESNQDTTKNDTWPYPLALPDSSLVVSLSQS
jgi:hypothetical protein